MVSFGGVVEVLMVVYRWGSGDVTVMVMMVIMMVMVIMGMVKMVGRKKEQLQHK